jgi:hypothetical protein
VKLQPEERNFHCFYQVKKLWLFLEWIRYNNIALLFCSLLDPLSPSSFPSLPPSLPPPLSPSFFLSPLPPQLLVGASDRLLGELQLVRDTSKYSYLSGTKHTASDEQMYSEVLKSMMVRKLLYNYYNNTRAHRAHTPRAMVHC